MSLPQVRWLLRGERLIESFEARMFLSIVILVSVLPTSTLEAALPSGMMRHRYLIFLCIFVPEFLLRLLLVNRRRKQRRVRKGEVVLLGLDFLAIVSFLPIAANASFLRFFRLTRLLLLLGYWRETVQQLWRLLVQRERRFQVFLVLILGVLLSLASTVLLIELRATYDFNGDGAIDGQDRNFAEIMWWSFRQVQDPGNLVPDLHDGVVVFISLALTFTGLLLFSFLIGIGTTVVGELVERSRSQKVGMHGHTVILGLPVYSTILLCELAEIYRKNLQPFRAAVLAPDLDQGIQSEVGLGGFRYRKGSPVRTSDLDRVDIRHAKRVIILGDESEDPDASVISAVLAARERSIDVKLFPDLEHERNFPAVRTAGGRRTDLVGSGSFLGYYLAQNVAYPGIDRLLGHLLTSVGCEIYTYLFSADERQRLAEQFAGQGLDVLALHRETQDQGITLLAVFTAPDPMLEYAPEDMDLLINPVRTWRQGRSHPALNRHGHLRPSRLRGLIGITLRFSDLSYFARRLVNKGLTFVGSDEVPSEGFKGPGGESVSQLFLEPARRSIRSVLILGAGPRAPRVIRELVGFFKQLEITVLARNREPMADIAHDAQTMLAASFGYTSETPEVDGGVIRLQLETSEVNAKVTFMVADWTHRHILEDEGAVTLSKADAILLLLGSDRSQDRDGSIALDCLHLANLERTAAVHLKPGAHILAMVRDPDKGRLLESRLTDMKGEGTASRYTVISRALVRHRFIMQSVFVPGINSLYLNLLSSKGQYLSRLLPSDVAGKSLQGGFDPVQVADHLLFEYGLIFIGLELHEEDEDGERVMIDPAEWQSLGDFPWSSVSALYVLGNASDMAQVKRTR